MKTSIIVCLASLALTPSFAIAADLEAPSAANGCGRTASVHLESANDHTLVPYPGMSLRRGMAGKTTLQVVVGKLGWAQQITVVKSSGYPMLDASSIMSINGRWQWVPPPQECQDTGVVLTTVIEWTFGEDLNR
jgi:TonB family protein